MSQIKETMTDEQKALQFSQAMHFVEDGDYEDACDIFSSLLDFFPEDRGMWWQYLSALRRSRNHEKADSVADFCYRSFPDDLGFVLEWTRCLDARAHWNESLRRRKEVLLKHTPHTNKNYLPLVTECFLPLVETKNFEELRRLIDEYWEVFLEDGHCGAAVYYALEALGDYLGQITLCDQLIARSELKQPIINNVNYANLRSMAQSAIWNKKAMTQRAPEVNVLSIGQSCLPYTIANRWGLINYVGDPDITIFDQGAFGRNSAPDALNSDFNSFLTPENYVQKTDPMGAPQMHHRPTGVHFGHERGLTIIGKDASAFHALIRKKIASFRKHFRKGNALLVYGIVGYVDINSFVSEIKNILETTHSQLFIANFTKEDMNTPQHPLITYAHIPFPHDYNWNDITHYTSDRGIAFDLQFTRALCRAIDRMP